MNVYCLYSRQFLRIIKSMKTFILEQDKEQGLVVVNDTEVLQIKVVWICLTNTYKVGW